MLRSAIKGPWGSLHDLYYILQHGTGLLLEAQHGLANLRYCPTRTRSNRKPFYIGPARPKEYLVLKPGNAHEINTTLGTPYWFSC